MYSERDFMKDITLYAFPCAGGTAKLFNDLKRCLKNKIELITFEYAGHGIRFGETLYDNFDSLCDDAAQIINKGTKYAFLGYSFGCSVAYQLCLSFNPQHMFMCANTPPYYDDKSNLSSLNHDEFLEEFKSLGGIPDELFDYPEVLDLYMPILRNDVKLEESQRRCAIHHIDCPLDIFYSDDITESEIKQ